MLDIITSSGWDRLSWPWQWPMSFFSHWRTDKHIVLLRSDPNFFLRTNHILWLRNQFFFYCHSPTLKRLRKLESGGRAVWAVSVFIEYKCFSCWSGAWLIMAPKGRIYIRILIQSITIVFFFFAWCPCSYLHIDLLPNRAVAMREGFWRDLPMKRVRFQWKTVGRCDISTTICSCSRQL